MPCSALRPIVLTYAELLCAVLFESFKPSPAPTAWNALLRNQIEYLAEFLKRLKQLDEDNDKQGLRAFAWSVTDSI